MPPRKPLTQDKGNTDQPRFEFIGNVQALAPFGLNPHLMIEKIRNVKDGDDNCEK